MCQNSIEGHSCCFVFVYEQWSKETRSNPKIYYTVAASKMQLAALTQQMKMKVALVLVFVSSFYFFCALKQCMWSHAAREIPKAQTACDHAVVEAFPYTLHSVFITFRQIAIIYLMLLDLLSIDGLTQYTLSTRPRAHGRVLYSNKYKSGQRMAMSL